MGWAAWRLRGSAWLDAIQHPHNVDSAHSRRSQIADEQNIAGTLLCAGERKDNE